jgi:7-cyano-7-deazaguanine synthase
MSKAILMSGGMDSTALVYWKKPEYAITINYGQRPAEAEIRTSKIICDLIGIKHLELNVDCSSLGSGDLANNTSLDLAPSSEWWPYRNQLLVTLASMKAIALGVNELMVASVKSDGFHTDGTLEFYKLIDQLINYQEGHLKVTAPAINLMSHELVILSKIPSEILCYAHSCHTGNIPCGTCRGCRKYISVFKKLKDEKWQKS